jgi:hypothetical protein
VWKTYLESIQFVACHHMQHFNIMKGYVWAWVLIQSSSALVLFHNFGALDDKIFVCHHHHPHHTSMCSVSLLL